MNSQFFASSGWMDRSIDRWMTYRSCLVIRRLKARWLSFWLDLKVALDDFLTCGWVFLVGSVGGLRGRLWSPPSRGWSACRVVAIKANPRRTVSCPILASVSNERSMTLKTIAHLPPSTYVDTPCRTYRNQQLATRSSLKPFVSGHIFQRLSTLLISQCQQLFKNDRLSVCLSAEIRSLIRVCLTKFVNLTLRAQAWPPDGVLPSIFQSHRSQWPLWGLRKVHSWRLKPSWLEHYSWWVPPRNREDSKSTQKNRLTNWRLVPSKQHCGDASIFS